jgi:energy-coupling factor transport system permease protein
MPEILAYVHKDGLFHRLHPVTKIFFVIVISIICILSSNPYLLTILVAILLALAYVSDLHTEIIQQSRLIIVMSVIFVIITLLTMPNGPIFAYLIPQGVPLIGGFFPLTWGALEIGIILSLRFMLLIYAFQLFLITTQPRDLVHTMERMKVPVDYTLMFIIALRFIPTLQIAGRRIHEAQLARGYNPGKGLIGKVRSVIPIIVPLVSNALGRATVLGLTIDIRGYRTARRTRIREFPFAPRDTLAIGLVASAGCLCGTLIFLQVM